MRVSSNIIAIFLNFIGNRDLFAMNEMCLKFNKIVIVFMSKENFRIPEMLFDSAAVYLRLTSNTVPWAND